MIKADEIRMAEKQKGKLVNNEKIKIAIADDHPGVRQGIRRVLEKIPEIRVVGEAEDGLHAIEIVKQLTPDLLILDIQMPDMDGIQVIQYLNQLGVDVLILVLSAIDDPLFIKETLSMGACFYVIKGDIQVLIQAVHHAIQDECQAKYSTRILIHVY
jgi:DNA-binding NarL/FixJ family response regulator